MFRRRALAAVAVLLGLGVAVLPVTASAQEWAFSTLANISATMGVNDGRLCVGEGSRQDIGCPTYAPYVDRATGSVGIGTNSPSSTLHVYSPFTSAIFRRDPASGVGGVGVILRNSVNMGFIAGVRSGTGDLALYPDNVSFAQRGLVIDRSSGWTGINIGETTPSSTFHVSGTLRIASGGEACDANRTGAIRYTAGDFSVCRNGSAWETLTAIANGSSPDRITSGTTSLVAISNTGFISLTQASTNTGWFDPTRGLVTLGVSATGGISGTTGYFAGNVGLGAAPAAARLTVNGNANNPALYVEGGASGAPIATFGRTSGASGTVSILAPGHDPQIQFNRITSSDLWAIGNDYSGFRIAYSSVIGTNNYLNILENGNVGISTTSPNAKLEVAGVVSATQFRGDGSLLTGLTAAPAGVSGSIQFNGGGVMAGRSDVVVSSDGNVGIGTSNPQDRLHVEGGYLRLGATGAEGGQLSLMDASGSGAWEIDNVTVGDVHKLRIFRDRGVSNTNVLSIGSNNVMTFDGIIEYLSGGSSFNAWQGITTSDGKTYMHIGGYGNMGTDRRLGLWADETFFPTGNVGVGTVTPTAKLEVVGRVSASVVQLNDDGAGCTTGTLGTIRRDPATGKFQICRM